MFGFSFFSTFICTTGHTVFAFFNFYLCFGCYLSCFYVISINYLFPVFPRCIGLILLPSAKAQSSERNLSKKGKNEEEQKTSLCILYCRSIVPIRLPSVLAPRQIIIPLSSAAFVFVFQVCSLLFV